jgi:hypothetical protein
MQPVKIAGAKREGQVSRAFEPKVGEGAAPPHHADNGRAGGLGGAPLFLRDSTACSKQGMGGVETAVPKWNETVLAGELRTEFH